MFKGVLSLRVSKNKERGYIDNKPVKATDDTQCDGLFLNALNCTHYIFSIAKGVYLWSHV